MKRTFYRYAIFGRKLSNNFVLLFVKCYLQGHQQLSDFVTLKKFLLLNTK